MLNVLFNKNRKFRLLKIFYFYREKKMRLNFLNIISIIVGVILVKPALGSQSSVGFDTPADAAKHCPALDNLTFLPLNSTDPKEGGWISSVFKGVNFYSMESYPSPHDVESNNIIKNVNYYKFCADPESCYYGINDGSNIVCYYIYPEVSNIQVPIEMMSSNET